MLTASVLLVRYFSLSEERAYGHTGLALLCIPTPAGILSVHCKTLQVLPRRAAQEDGDYAHAFWLCVQCGQAMSGAGALRCAQPLADRVNALYEETINRLELAMQACCKDFKPDTLCKVGECSGLP